VGVGAACVAWWSAAGSRCQGHLRCRCASAARPVDIGLPGSGCWRLSEAAQGVCRLGPV